MKGFITTALLIGAIFITGALASWIYIDEKGIGAPVANQLRNIFPIVNQTYDLGTTTPALEWKGVYTQDLFVSGTCTGCGAGDPNVIITNSFLRASTTGNVWLFPDGFVSQASSTIPLATISGSTFSTVQDMQNIFHSAGWVSGGGITDDTDGTITVAAGTGLIRATDGATAEILFFDWAAESGANVDLVDNDVSYVYAEYNSGSPRAIATKTQRTDFNTNVLIAVVAREGTTLHINTADRQSIGDHANNMIRRLKATVPYGHDTGGILSETGTRNIDITAGTF